MRSHGKRIVKGPPRWDLLLPKCTTRVGSSNGDVMPLQMLLPRIELTLENSDFATFFLEWKTYLTCFSFFYLDCKTQEYLEIFPRSTAFDLKSRKLQQKIRQSTRCKGRIHRTYSFRLKRGSHDFLLTLI